MFHLEILWLRADTQSDDESQTSGESRVSAMIVQEPSRSEGSMVDL